jgi:hypothetical protein
MSITFKSIIYLIVSALALFCFIYSMIHNRNELVLSLEMYTTLGAFLYYGYSFFQELKGGNAVIIEERSDNFCVNFMRFIFSYKFLYSIMIASLLNFVIQSLRSNWENFDRDAGTVLVMVLSKLFLPIFSIFNVVYGIERGKLTSGNDITGLIIAFLVYFVINVIILSASFATEEKFSRIFSVTLGNVLLLLFFAMSSIPMHDYFFKVKPGERLLV